MRVFGVGVSNRARTIASAACVGVALFVTESRNVGEAQVAPDVILQENHIRYDGAFRVPTDPYANFSFSGQPIAFNPVRQSLFIGRFGNVAEITIPQVVNSSNIGDLKVSSILQPWYEISENRYSLVNRNGAILGDMLVFGNSLIGSAYAYYDAMQPPIQPSHFIRPTDFTRVGATQGLFRVSNRGGGVVSKYMMHVPPKWQAALGGPVLTGGCCISIVARTSSGPSLYAINPADLGVKDPVPAIELAYYDEGHPLGGKGYTGDSLLWSGTTEIAGGIFPEGSRSVLYFGVQGTGPFCYATGVICHDPEFDAQGPHRYPYRYQVWAYDANDLLAVKNGQKLPYQIEPYAIWSFTFPIAQKVHNLNGVAFDPATNRLFLSQADVDTNNVDFWRPIIHVYTVLSTPLKRPTAPTNVRISG